MAGNKKGVETRKEKYGDDYQSRIAANGGRKRTRGYFGYLKDTGQLEELKKISKEAGAAGARKTQGRKVATTEGGSDYQKAKGRGNPVHRTSEGQI